MLEKPNRLTFSDMRLLELPEEKFISSIDYSWETKWTKYNYSNEEKTFLIIKNLERAMQLRPDIIEIIYEKLLLLNDEEEVKNELNDLFTKKYQLKKNDLIKAW
ncbi:hypothetical protein LZ480_00155 [Solibacillus sp. MA9]|uniref:Uncharacterized protein n=1 Tax=Solibacillus palustris TaxID=2908203 RepID=A0ABS9U7H2_9BACL|nr:hypothetical protein [Solibacillus sp. MA9]MCH7320283.1 hypothetical protein [Solibacillus sp. MA9]